MSRYAVGTSVSAETSRAEIERVLRRYGARAFAYATEPKRAMLGFEAAGRRVRFLLPMPDPADPVFLEYTRGRVYKRTHRRSEDQAHRLWEQATRQAWRALALVVKAKLEAVAAGITTFEDEFMAHIVIPETGKTIGEWLKPQLGAIYDGRRALPPWVPGAEDNPKR